MRGVLRTMRALGLAVGGLLPSAAAAGPVLVIDAVADPGVNLLLTFVPQGWTVGGGIRRVAGRQSVVSTVPVALSDALPTSWMVSVLRKGDVAPNIATIPVSDATGKMVFSLPGEMDVVMDGGEWQLPNFDSRVFVVEVGFSMGTDLVLPAYTVACRPGQRLRMAVGGYQVIRSDGDDALGTAIKSDLESWNVPPDRDSVLTFDSKGVGTIRPLP